MKPQKVVGLSIPFRVIPEAPTGVYSCIRTSAASVRLPPSLAATHGRVSQHPPAGD